MGQVKPRSVRVRDRDRDRELAAKGPGARAGYPGGNQAATL